MTRSSTTQAVSDGSSTSSGVWRLAVTSRRISDNVLALATATAFGLATTTIAFATSGFQLVPVNLKTSA
jgi:hypothetical protein